VDNQIHQGVVIYSGKPYHKKIIILDDNLGKVEAVLDDNVLKNRLIHGALIEYTYRPWHHMYQLFNTTYVSAPADWVDLVFLHHILEMSNYFLAIHCNAHAVFNLFTLLYQPYVHHNALIWKKIFMCRFFSLLGICPINALDYDSDFFHLISQPINIMLNIQKDIRFEKKIDRWLLGCMHTHPHAHMFKTVNFITKNGHL
jgi:hypothetical protein